jgi:hypothetical protein
MGLEIRRQYNIISYENDLPTTARKIQILKNRTSPR